MLQTRAKAVLTWVLLVIALPFSTLGIVVIIVIAVPLALLIALLMAIDCAWWHSRGGRFHAGRVLATRWIVLPSAVRGRTIAVRKDMRVAISGWWWAINCGAYLNLWSIDVHLIPDPPLLLRTGRSARAHSDFTSLSPAAALSIVKGCRSIVQGCRSCHGLPLEKFEALLAESSAAAHLAAARIQRAWRGAIADPKRAVCRARVMHEFAELTRLSGDDLV